MTEGNSKDLITAEPKPDEAIFDYMSRVQDNLAKAFPKLADSNPQDMTVSMFSQGLPGQEFGRITAIKGNGEVPRALSLATSVKAFGKNQHYSKRYDPSRPRYSANVAEDDQQGDAEEGHEATAEADYEELEEVLFAGSRNFRGIVRWRRRRGSYGAGFGRPGYRNANPTLTNKGRLHQGRVPAPALQSSCTTGPLYEQHQQALICSRTRDVSIVMKPCI